MQRDRDFSNARLYLFCGLKNLWEGIPCLLGHRSSNIFRHDLLHTDKGPEKDHLCGGGKYRFAGKTLRFLPNTAPVKRKYLNADDSVVRHDILQALYFEENLNPDTVVWDIGSHNGHYSVFSASVAKGKGQVFSFEPNGKVLDIQRRNIALNRLEDKVTVMEMVVAGHDGQVSFLEREEDANSRLIKEGGGAASGATIKDCVTLDTLLTRLPHPDLVKIDTEGAEIDILKGGSKLLSDPSIRIIMELHPFAWDDFGVRYEDLVDVLQRHNRTIRLLDRERSLNDLPFYAIILA